ncbi:MAG: membrane protein insertase YidC [Nakamurella sp.]
MTFSFWSLDFIYYPVSGIMWVWHKVFGFLFGALGVSTPYSNAWTWVLSVMFLVFTLRAIMFKPFMKQMDSSLKMQAIQPEMKRLKAKHKDDRQRLTEEMMKLNKEAGVNPLASCLPALLQAPAFIGLFHVLRNFIYAFNPNLVNPALSSKTINNYFFPAVDVSSFHDALLFGGASLSAHLTMTDAQLTALQSTREAMLWVGIPLMILAAIATHMSSRKSVARQTQIGTGQTGGQAAIMQKLMLYGFPLGVIFIGWFYPIALLFYWLANNSWTFAQLGIAHRVQDKKLAVQALVVEAEKDSTTFTKPRPGARPVRDGGRGVSVTATDLGSTVGGSTPTLAPTGRVDEEKRSRAAKARSESAARDAAAKGSGAKGGAANKAGAATSETSGTTRKSDGVAGKSSGSAAKTGGAAGKNAGGAARPPSGTTKPGAAPKSGARPKPPRKPRSS